MHVSSHISTMVDLNAKVLSVPFQESVDERLRVRADKRLGVGFKDEVMGLSSIKTSFFMMGWIHMTSLVLFHPM